MRKASRGRRTKRAHVGFISFLLFLVLVLGWLLYQIRFLHHHAAINQKRVDTDNDRSTFWTSHPQSSWKEILAMSPPPPVPSVLVDNCAPFATEGPSPDSLRLPHWSIISNTSINSTATRQQQWCQWLTDEDRQALKPLEAQRRRNTQITSAAASHKKNNKSPKILCMVYTIQNRQDRWSALIDTWASECDGFVLASNYTHHHQFTYFHSSHESSFSVTELKVPHKGPENYDNMWQKVQCIWATVYQLYGQEYDWFYICGDDTWVLVDSSLKGYLQSLTLARPSKPQYVGATAAHDGNASRLFHLGGPGYALNRAALRVLISQGLPQSPLLDREASFEDIFMGQIFRDLDIPISQTHDDHGRARFLHLSPQHYAQKRYPKWYQRSQDNLPWMTAPLGPGFVSSEAVAFHRMGGDKMRAYHAWLYGYCAIQG